MRVFAALFASALLSTVACTSASSGEPVEHAGSEVTTGAAAPTAAPAQLAYTPQFVLEKVLERKVQTFDAHKPFPTIRFASQITLTEFQDALESQWGMRPNVITNAYAVASNTIYMMDDAAYYTSHHRCIDDSLAHELTHYVQVIYQGWILDGMDDSIEANAIDVQTWFRESFCQSSL